MLLLVSWLIPLLSAPLSRFFEAVFGREGFFAMKNLEWNRHRAAVTVSVVFSMVTVIIMVSGGEHTFYKSYDNYMERCIGADIFIYTDGLEVKDIPPLRAVEGVGELAYSYSSQVTVGGEKIYASFIRPEDHFRLSAIPFKEGDEETAVKMLNEGDAIIISAEYGTKSGSGFGDTVQVDTELGEVDFRVAGVAYLWRNVVSWRDGEKYFGYNQPREILVRVEDGHDIEQVREAIYEHLTDKGFRPIIQTLEEEKKEQRKETAQTMYSLKAMLLVVIFIAAIAVFNTMYLSTMERTRETGIMRSLGHTRHQVLKVILLEGLTLCAVGTAIGILFSIYQMAALARGLEHFIGLRTPFVVPTGAIGIAAVVSLVVSVAGSIYPAHRSASGDISEALRYE